MPIDIGDSEGRRWEMVGALADTGASYTWAPAAVLARLGVRPPFRREFVTADGRVIERDMAVTMVRWDGQVLPTLVVFGGDDSLPLLGAYTLEGFGLAPDPSRTQVEAAEWLTVRGFGDPPKMVLGDEDHPLRLLVEYVNDWRRHDPSAS